MTTDLTTSTPASDLAQGKPPVVLVHGAFATDQVWGHVAARLQAAGHDVVTVNLPGRPGRPTPPANVTLTMHRDTVLAALELLDRPAIVVGHSFAGIVISAAAEAAPEKIDTLVFVAAYLPEDGDSLVSMAQQDPDASIGPNLTIDPVNSIAVVAYAARAELFVNDGPDGLKAKLPDLIVDEPLTPLGTPVELSDQRFGRVRKAYVRTALDQVISPAFQARMIKRAQVRTLATLQTGHLPFLTDPDGLANAIGSANAQETL
jgi:pimeloyl-ACP methyl ester carboxylesterase